MFVEKPVSQKKIDNRRLIAGVGINDAPYVVIYRKDGKLVRCPFYRQWENIMTRAYSSKFHERNPTYKNCSVDPRWHKFMNFRRWMEKQNWEGNQLDKDLLVNGNKIYSQDTCIFVSQEVNTILLSRNSLRGEYPRGVSYHKLSRRYCAEVSRYGVKHLLGYYDTPEEAYEVYVKEKVRHVREVADKYEAQVRNALLREAQALEDTLTCQPDQENLSV